MNSDFRECLIEDICLVKGGKRLPKGENLLVSKTNHPYIRTKDIKDGVIDTSSIEYVPDSVFPSISRYTVDKGDLIVSIVGTIGNCAITPDHLDKASLTENCAKLINLDKGRLDTFFLYYFLSGSSGQALIKERVVGSTQPKLPLYGIESIPVALPSIEEQKAIANILGTLDDKIELNRKTNETLEGIAKALFKSWFVDFDPVRAKAEGRSTGLPDEISELFPDSFEESDLGEIPKGWGCRQLRELIESIKDRQEDRLLEEFSATVTGIEPRDDRFKKNLAKSSNKNRVAYEGDLVFGLSRRVINFGRMPRSIGAFSPVYEVFRSLPGAPISTKFIEEQIRQRMSEFMIILKPAAREGQAIDREIFLDQLVSIAPGKVIAAFEVLADLIESRMRSLAENINVLEQMRDALLPRLISGELRIPDAEKMLEEVGI